MKYLNHKEKAMEKFAEKVCNLMLSLIRKTIRWDNNHLSRGIITIPQLHVLFFLSTRAFSLMSDINKEMGIKGSTLTAMMDKLVSLGFVKRIPGESDRRTVLVSLTQKGKKILERFLEDRKKIIIRIFRNLSSEERKNYVAILEKVVQQAENDNGMTTIKALNYK